MKQFPVAAALEASIRQEIERLMAVAPPELQPLLAIVAKFQAEFELLLDRAQYTDADTGKYPEVAAVALLGADEVWQGEAAKFAAQPDKTAADLTALWAVHAFTTGSAQYYRQATLNSPHPSTRLLFGSLAEVKTMLRRRLDGLLRTMYNEIWAEVGFAPFTLKD